MALCHLTGPEQVKNGEIYSAANDREQAAQVFKAARQMVEMSPILSERLRIVPSTKTIVNYRNGSFYRAISAEAGTKHGYNPTVVIYDELAQAKKRDLYDVLDTSFGGRAEPLFIVISTQSNDPEHVMSQLVDDGLADVDSTIVCHLHAADEGCDLLDETQWKKANPALGDFRDYNDLAGAIQKATRIPAEEPKVRNLFLNQRVSPVAPLLSRAEWMGCKGEVEFVDGEEIYLSLDLSSTNDLTALAIGSANDPARVKVLFWKPDEHLLDHSNRDFGAGNNRYVEWHNSGHLLTTSGRTVDHEAIALKVAELHQRYKVIGLAYDRWRVNNLLKEFDRIGLVARLDEDKGDGLRIVPWGQGFRDISPAIDALELAVINRNLIHDNSPLLNWNIANAVSVMDPAGNRKIDKRASRFRIDGAVALAIMMGLRARDRNTNPAVDVEAMIV